MTHYSPANNRITMYIVEPTNRTTVSPKNQFRLAEEGAENVHASPATENNRNAIYPFTSAAAFLSVVPLSFAVLYCGVQFASYNQR